MDFELVSQWVGLLGCLEVILAIFFFFFKFIPYFFIPKKVSIKLLFTYIYIYLIYVGASPQCRVFFFRRGCLSSHLQQVGKVIPTIAVHPVSFLILQDEPGTRRKPGEEDSHGCYTQ